MATSTDDPGPSGVPQDPAVTTPVTVVSTPEAGLVLKEIFGICRKDWQPLTSSCEKGDRLLTDAEDWNNPLD